MFQLVFVMNFVDQDPEIRWTKWPVIWTPPASTEAQRRSSTSWGWCSRASWSTLTSTSGSHCYRHWRPTQQRRCVVSVHQTYIASTLVMDESMSSPAWPPYTRSGSGNTTEWLSLLPISTRTGLMTECFWRPGDILELWSSTSHITNGCPSFWVQEF